MKNTKTSIFIAFAALILAAGLSACSSGGIGIFASIAGETPIDAGASKGFKAATPSFVASFKDSYYAGIGQLWSRKKTDPTWAAVSKLPSHSGATLSFADCAATLGDKLYVGFKDANGGSAGIWSISAVNGDWERTDSSFPAASGSASVSLIKLFAVNGTLFAACSQTEPAAAVSTYSLYYLKADGTFAAEAGVSKIATRPTDLCWDGSAYFLSAETALYTGTAAGALASSSALRSNVEATVAFTSLCYDSELKLLASSSNGKIYQSTDKGLKWTASSAYEKKTVPYYLSQLQIVSFGEKKALLACTDIRYTSSKVLSPVGGYLEFDVTGLSDITKIPAENAAKNLIADLINYDTTVGNNSVPRMFLFSEEDGSLNLFAGTGAHGLWLNKYATDKTWKNWQRESD